MTPYARPDSICTTYISFEVSELSVSGIPEVPLSQSILYTRLHLALAPHR